jgi:hypothetical protein
MIIYLANTKDARLNQASHEDPEKVPNSNPAVAGGMERKAVV